MFIETHVATELANLKLAFVKSINITAFPCGRRRSQAVKIDANADRNITDAETYNIPYDPEARLNTEANNRKHSGLNGYKQSYLGDWKASGNDYLTISLLGYLFKIKLDNTLRTANGFGVAVKEALGITPVSGETSIYANIRLEDVPLYTGLNTYTTSILRNQTKTDEALGTLDLLNSVARDNHSLVRSNPNDYFFFSGLSFTTLPISEDTSGKAFSERPITESKQHVASIRILDYIDGAWRVHQPALLPKVDHGEEEDSVEVGTLHATNILLNDVGVPSIKLVPGTGSTERLKITFGTTG
jgi:hypothetical protein